MKVRILLADDHQIVREGLRALLKNDSNFDLVGEAADGVEAVRLVERLKPDVLVLDLMMKNLGGIEVARQVSHTCPNTHIVVLSMNANEGYVVAALRAGAKAYVVKETGADHLHQAIRAVLSGKQYFSPPISEDALQTYLQKTEGTPIDLYQTLTFREREVLQMTAEGHSSTEISKRLFISPRTVETHRANLMRKLRVRNLKELIRYAVERKILPPGEPTFS